MAILASSTTSNVANNVNYQLMNGLLSAARRKFPFFNGTLPGVLEKNKSTASVIWERLNNLATATTTLSEPTGVQSAFFGRSTVLPTVSTVTATIAKKGNAVLLTEEIELQQMNLRAMKFMDLLGENAGASLNTLMETVYAGQTEALNIRYATGAAGGGSAVTDVMDHISATDINWATNRLDRESAMTFTTAGFGSTNVGSSPIRASYFGICHPDVKADIRGITGFHDVVTYGGYMETLPFEFGEALGVRWCESELCPISTGAGTDTSDGTLRGASTVLNDVYASYIYGKEAVGSVGFGQPFGDGITQGYDPKKPTAVEIIYKPIGTVGTDLYNEVCSIAWKAWWAGAILNTKWLTVIKSGASKL